MKFAAHVTCPYAIIIISLAFVCHAHFRLASLIRSLSRRCYTTDLQHLLLHMHSDIGLAAAHNWYLQVVPVLRRTGTSCQTSTTMHMQIIFDIIAANTVANTIMAVIVMANNNAAANNEIIGLSLACKLNCDDTGSFASTSFRL